MKSACSTAAPKVTGLRDHGVALHKGVCFSYKPWRDAETGRDYVYAGIIGTSSLVVQLDVVTGRCRAFHMPPSCSGPWGMTFTLEGHVLVTSTSGQLCRLDPRTGEFRITANTGHWNWSIDRGADGKFYIVTANECRLFRYDAVTEKLEDLGQLDKSEMNARHVIGGNDGYLYVGIGTMAAQVVAYHIATGRMVRLLPKSEVRPGFQLVGRGRDGQLYTQTVRRHIYRLAHGQAFFDASLSRQCRAQPPEEFLAELSMPTLPDGRKVTLVDLDHIRVGEGPASRLWPLTYKTEGTALFHLAAGPDRTVYASTIYPLHLVRYTPATRKLEDLGRGGPDRAEAYSIGHCDGKVYYGTYSGALLMCYDPAKPLHQDPPGGQKWKTNPRLLGYLGRGNCRPRAICVDSQKRVWVGGIPDYGYRHGGLACYDTRRRTLTVHDAVISDQSVLALTADESGATLYGGTSTTRGGGLAAATPEAHLFAWDTRRNKRLWKQAPIPGAAGILNLLYRDGKLYGSTGNNFSFFRFDLKSRTMDYNVPSRISAIREQSLCWGPDGNLYGITWMSLLRWRPETGQIDVLYRCEGDEASRYEGGSLFHRGAVIIDGRLYFSCGSRVMSLRIPLETPMNRTPRGR